jgi:hypothetical protein
MGTQGLSLALFLLAGARNPLDAQTSPPPAWRTQLELGFNGARGNTSFVVLRSGVSVTHLRTDVAEIEASGLYRYGKSDGELIARDWRGSLKLDVVPNQRLSPFAFATASGDALRRLAIRSEGGAGAKYTYWRSERGAASISGAALYSVESYDRAMDSSRPASQRSAKWSVRSKGETTVGRARIAQTTFYQPVWDSGADYTLEATTSLSAQLVGRLDLVLVHEYLYDATPPADVLRTDQKVSVVFRYEF